MHDGWDDLNSTGPCSDDSHPFVPQITLALPPGTMEALALEWLHPFKPWGLGVAQEPTSRYDMRADQNFFLAICPCDLNFPFAVLLNPFGTVYSCCEPETVCCFKKSLQQSLSLDDYLSTWCGHSGQNVHSSLQDMQVFLCPEHTMMTTWDWCRRKTKGGKWSKLMS